MRIIDLLKIYVKPLKDLEKTSTDDYFSCLEQKEMYFNGLSELPFDKQNYYKKCYILQHKKIYMRFFISNFVNILTDLDIDYLYLNFVRWVLIDLLRGKRRGGCGIYCFVGMRGQGKTMSMTAHIQRFRARYIEKGQKFVVATNYDYRYQDFAIEDWTDIITIAKDCYTKGIPSLIAFDEVQNTFDSLEYKDFPPAMGSFISFVRKYNCEFLVSAQQYDRIPKRIRDNADFIIVCENIGHFDRLFRSYYFEKTSYDFEFADTKGKKKKANYIREFVADDEFYSLYDTKAQVARMVKDVKTEKAKQKAAMEYLNSLPEAEN